MEAIPSGETPVSLSKKGCGAFCPDPSHRDITIAGGSV